MTEDMKNPNQSVIACIYVTSMNIPQEMLKRVHEIVGATPPHLEAMMDEAVSSNEAFRELVSMAKLVANHPDALDSSTTQTARVGFSTCFRESFDKIDTMSDLLQRMTDRRVGTGEREPKPFPLFYATKGAPDVRMDLLIIKNIDKSELDKMFSHEADPNFTMTIVNWMKSKLTDARVVEIYSSPNATELIPSVVEMSQMMARREASGAKVVEAYFDKDGNLEEQRIIAKAMESRRPDPTERSLRLVTQEQMDRVEEVMNQAVDSHEDPAETSRKLVEALGLDDFDAMIGTGDEKVENAQD